MRRNGQGAALVSARIFSMLKAGGPSPYVLIMDVLGPERYPPIAA